jgi:hypothetical protein
MTLLAALLPAALTAPARADVEPPPAPPTAADSPMLLRFPFLLTPSETRDLLNPPPAPAADPWAVGERPDREPVKAKVQGDAPFGTLTGQQTLQTAVPAAVWNDPNWKRTWQAEQAWRSPVLGPFSLFAQLGAASEEAAEKDMRLTGRTGLACQLPVPLGGEFQLRSGPTVTCTDPLRPERAQEKSELLVEVQGRLPLLFGVGLEYQGSAVPALTPQERDRLTQDLRLALPVGTSGKLRLGARRQWENVLEARPGAESTQLYMGLELAR